MTDGVPPDRPTTSRGRSSATGWLVVVGVSMAVVTVALAGLAGAVGWLVERDHGGSGDVVASSTVGRSTDGYEVWDRTADGTPVRWDPCTDIEIVIDPSQAPPGARDDLEEAAHHLGEVTGLTLVVTGITDERPAGARPAYQPERYGERWAPVLVSWIDPGANGVPLRDTDRGIAVPIAVGPEDDRTYVTGQIALNARRDDLVGGFEDRATSWGATILHELAHVLGLAHVDDPAALMYVHPGEGPVRFGPGDLAGLAAVGADHGCRDVPDAGPVEVAEPPR